MLPPCLGTTCRRDYQYGDTGLELDTSREGHDQQRPAGRGQISPSHAGRVSNPLGAGARSSVWSRSSSPRSSSCLAGQGLRWAIRHGDPSLDNIHITHDGNLGFYDLDLAGPGWQAEDLAGAVSTTFAGPFLGGYVSTRPLPAVDMEALPWLRMLSAIDNPSFI